ncbi:MAG: hypothetical protein ROO76_01375 [Terriglobia bacterium]|jgi:hypothetical protein|nr:hypothetical protein [Terriglobia bacterium]
MSYRREEWIASLLAGAASVWFVSALCHDARHLFQVLPPTGPTEMIGVAVLIWLHAKHKRDVERRTPVFANFPECSLPLADAIK